MPKSYSAGSSAGSVMTSGSSLIAPPRSQKQRITGRSGFMSETMMKAAVLRVAGLHGFAHVGGRGVGVAAWVGVVEGRDLPALHVLDVALGSHLVARVDGVVHAALVGVASGVHLQRRFSPAADQTQHSSGASARACATIRSYFARLRWKDMAQR